MPPESNDLERAYNAARPGYEKLVAEVIFALREGTKGRGFTPSIKGRVKMLESLVEKTKRQEESGKNLSEIHDIAGVRVVCQFTRDLEVIGELISSLFEVIWRQEIASLGFDKMGYQGNHYVVSLGDNYRGPRYNGINSLVCEIQVRTILQDAWAQISHSLHYKSEASIPDRERRELYNVSSLLEVSQSIFDRTLETRRAYSDEVRAKQRDSSEFLSQRINRETLAAYTRWKYPLLSVNDKLQELLIRDINQGRYQTLKDIDSAVIKAAEFVNAYRSKAPTLFQSGTDHITKSLGFVDKEFRNSHGFGKVTRLEFSRAAGG